MSARLTTPGLGLKSKLSWACQIGLALVLLFVLLQGCGGGQPIRPWHSKVLDEEFNLDMLEGKVRNLGEYRALEERLFQQLDAEIYAGTAASTETMLMRYINGSLADPHRRTPDWNRTFELTADDPIGGILLLHGMSDSPYSLRALGESLNQRGYWVVGLRLPGHGTIPSGLKKVTWQDMSAVVGFGMAHLSQKLGDKPIHMIGYSTGATLALNYVLDLLDAGAFNMPKSIILISPAIRVSAAGAFAGFRRFMSSFPGLGRWAYLSVMQEYDPYKYNSFATNAGAQVFKVTRSVTRRIKTLSKQPEVAGQLPPILAFKSTVDATVTTEAVVDNLLMGLPAGRNELVLFDINRHAAIQSTLLVADPGPLTLRLKVDESLPFAVTFITNESPESARLVARYKPPFSLEKAEVVPLGYSWPSKVISLSHVALPFPPNDPVYGETPPERDDFIFLGDLAFRGERDLVELPGDFLLRLRSNPFYSYMQQRVFQWLDSPRLEAVADAASDVPKLTRVGGS